jgi:hypothetical protein
MFRMIKDVIMREIGWQGGALSGLVVTLEPKVTI